MGKAIGRVSERKRDIRRGRRICLIEKGKKEEREVDQTLYVLVFFAAGCADDMYCTANDSPSVASVQHCRSISGGEHM